MPEPASKDHGNSAEPKQAQQPASNGKPQTQCSPQTAEAQAPAASDHAKKHRHGEKAGQQPQQPAKQENAAKPQQPSKQENAAKPQQPAKQENAAKPQ